MGGLNELDQAETMVPTRVEAGASNDQSSAQNQVGNKEEEGGIPSRMMYCASEIAPPPPVVIPSSVSTTATATTTTQLSKITKVAAPLAEEQMRSIPKKHDILCKCGCIPAIPSMFQMAELRKQAREKAKREQET